MAGDIATSNMDDATYFFQYDIPRLRELMMSSDSKVQACSLGEA